MNIFSKAASLISVFASLLPIIRTSVVEVETALGAGNGSTKMTAVLAMTQAAFAALDGVETTWAEIAPAVTSVVNAFVVAFNAVNAFAHGTTPAAPAPAPIVPAATK